MAAMTSSFARLFTLLTLALSFLAVVVAGPIPEATTNNTELDLEKRTTHTGVATYFYQNGNAG